MAYKTDQEMLDAWQKCEWEIATYGQSIGHDGRTRREADLPEVRKQISWYQKRLNNTTREAYRDYGANHAIGVLRD